MPSMDAPEDAPLEAAAYPQRNQRVPVKAPISADSGARLAGAGVSLGSLTEPVLLKGPLKIPLPEVLRHRAGSLRISLKCSVGADGKADVTIEEGTGMVALDESVRASFSNLAWYPAEQNGKPVAMAIRLVIETGWQSGQPAIDWGGRIPR